MTNRSGVVFQDEILSVPHRTVDMLLASLRCIETYTILVNTAYGQDGMQHSRLAESGLDEYCFPKGEDKEAVYFRFDPTIVPIKTPFLIQSQTLKSVIRKNSWNDELRLPTAIEVSSAAPNPISITYTAGRLTPVTNGLVLITLYFSQPANTL